MDENNIAWAAGFLDGEGTFLLATISKKCQRTKGVIRRRPILSASQSLTKEPLDKLKNILGGSVCKATRKTITGRPVWIWSLNSAKSIHIVLVKLLPHLTVKVTPPKFY